MSRGGADRTGAPGAAAAATGGAGGLADRHAGGETAGADRVDRPEPVAPAAFPPDRQPAAPPVLSGNPIDAREPVAPPAFPAQPLAPRVDLSEWLIEHTSDAYLVTDARGVIRRASPAAAPLLAVPRPFLAGKPLGLFVHRADLGAFRWLLKHVQSSATARTAQLRMRTRAGVEFTAKVTVQVLDSGAMDGTMAWLLADCSVRERLGELAAASQFAREQLELERELRVAAEERRHAAEAAAEVARRADVTLPPRDLLRVVAEVVLAVCEVPGARVSVSVPEAEGGRIDASAGTLDLPPGGLLESPFGMEALAWSDRVPRCTGDARRDERLDATARDRAAQAGIVSQLAVPLVAGPGVAGVVSSCARERDRFSPADEELLVRVAEQAGVALAHALRYQQQQAARLAAERALAGQARGLLAPALFDACPLGLVLATDERIAAANPAFLALVGRPPADVTAGRLSWRELVGPDAAGRLREALAAALGGGDPGWVATACRTPDGAVRDVLVGFVVLRPAAAEWVGIVLDPSRERAAAELVRARQQADAASRAKDEFMAVLGHELRNPLAAIRNAAAVLEAKGATDEEALRLVAIVTRQVRHAARLVDDLLDLTRVLTGKVRLQREPLDLRAVVDGAIAELARAGRTRDHRLAVTGELTFVDADSMRLEQVVTNLLDNALKYTPPGGRVEVTVRRDDADAVLSVSDTGFGLTPEMQTRVFELFAQEGRVLDRSRGGLGLGLPLVRRLVRLHGGTVTASSPGPGRGSTFTVRLPLLRSGRAELRAGAATAPVPSRRVLIVDDHEDSRLSLRLLLEREGHKVEEAADGPSGLAAVLRATSEVALVDVAMPGLDGYELARRARAARGAHAGCLIAVTGFGQADDRERALEAGFDGHLAKPVELAALAAVLRDLPRRGAPVKGPRKASPAPRAPGEPPGESVSAVPGA